MHLTTTRLLLQAAGAVATSTAYKQRIVAPAPAAVNTTTCNGQFYAYTQLAGYGALSGNARDKFGDTVGGIGSAIALQPGSWAVSDDGAVYTGVLWGMPDRGW